jgi:hypothetical protein
MSAGLHGGDRGVLADAAGDDDEGEVEAGFMEEAEGGGGAELGEVVVREDEVPGFGLERLDHLGLGFDPFMDGGIATFAQQVEEKLRIPFRIFDQEHSQRYFHSGSDPRQGESHQARDHP